MKTKTRARRATAFGLGALVVMVITACSWFLPNPEYVTSYAQATKDVAQGNDYNAHATAQLIIAKAEATTMISNSPQGTLNIYKEGRSDGSVVGWVAAGLGTLLVMAFLFLPRHG